MQSSGASALTVMRRIGVRAFAPLEVLPRMDGRLGVFAAASGRRDAASGGAVPSVALAVPLSCTLHRGQRTFAPAPALWRAVAAVAGTTNFPAYFEVASDDPDETVDEQAQRMERASGALRERKWLEGHAALFMAACAVRGRGAAPLRPVEQLTAWSFEHHAAGAPLVDETPLSIEEVEARFRVMQACSLLDANLLDAVAIAPDADIAALFGPVARQHSRPPVGINDTLARAVETAAFGAVFAAPPARTGRSRVQPARAAPLFYYAPYISLVNAATEPAAANCAVEANDEHVVVRLLRPLRAGEELLKVPSAI
jgi:hypothetical protein